MRLFVALFPSEDARSDLRRHLRTATTRPVRLTPADDWHITMAFLGEIPDPSRPSIEQAITPAVAGGPVRLRLTGGGSFGTAQWAGVDGDLPALFRLQAALRRALNLDDRPFTPHLTVTYRGSREVRAALDGYAGPSWTATELVLVRSHHTTAGGYEPLRSWSL
ncbi:RNA 2',3'-cyclic phosphodiesterase [Actinoplanes sp. NPDC049265]|uniref:RNA 2',3'-cyclic phosphodiesterase n=1 Tax=Actinoplanes sp. NPDC049265 TaxID=3363902 RepID=UPI0037207E9F